VHSGHPAPDFLLDQEPYAVFRTSAKAKFYLTKSMQLKSSCRNGKVKGALLFIFHQCAENAPVIRFCVRLRYIRSLHSDRLYLRTVIGERPGLSRYLSNRDVARPVLQACSIATSAYRQMRTVVQHTAVSA